MTGAETRQRANAQCKLFYSIIALMLKRCGCWSHSLFACARVIDSSYLSINTQHCFSSCCCRVLYRPLHVLHVRVSASQSVSTFPSCHCTEARGTQLLPQLLNYPPRQTREIGKEEPDEGKD